ENIFFYGTILGFKKNEIESRVNEIIKFADIGEFIDQPVKTYSSGMFVRLAFAVQTSLKPDILLVDEVLSVGDIFFQQKCHGRIEELMSQGTALVLVSHDMQLIEKYSTNTLLLENGKCLELGNPHSVIQKYLSLSVRYELHNNKINNSIQLQEIIDEKFSNKKASINNWPIDQWFVGSTFEQIGDKRIAEITKFCVCNLENKIMTFCTTGDVISFFYEIKIKKDISIPVGAVIFTNSRNIVVHGKDTLQYATKKNIDIKVVKANSIVRINQKFQIDLAPGEYSYTLGFGTVELQNSITINQLEYSVREDFIKPLSRIPKAGKFIVKKSCDNLGNYFHGYVNLEGDFFLSIISK
ncbi:MAG: ABC transporter ATP-binding protein, partial [Actinobacteria bacterium]|nr:ABC transporter ATP-binding protein [Actinomycetota bacterium]